MSSNHTNWVHFYTCSNLSRLQFNQGDVFLRDALVTNPVSIFFVRQQVIGPLGESSTNTVIPLTTATLAKDCIIIIAYFITACPTRVALDGFFWNNWGTLIVRKDEVKIVYERGILKKH